MQKVSGSRATSVGNQVPAAPCATSERLRCSRSAPAASPRPKRNALQLGFVSIEEAAG